jgi:uncharacterized protein (DUF488 family)
VPRVLTIGHSNRSQAELALLLAAHGVRHLVDVRRQPASRRHPQFHRRALAAGLAAAGIGYTWLEALGGLRTPSPATPHAALDGALAGYAEHMATAAFVAAIDRLRAIADAAPTAVMCAEADPASCHRRLLADWLALHGWDVRHVRSPDTPVVHVVTDSARLAGDVVMYDRGQRSLF